MAASRTNGSFFNWIKFESILHGIKTAIAFLIGLTIFRMKFLTVDQWLVITIVVVMCAQVNVGSTIQKAIRRFFGTLFGSMAAIVTLGFFGQNTLIIDIVLTISVMLFSYIATSQEGLGEAGTLGAVTMIIILIYPNPTELIAIKRFLEISSAIAIAALVSQFVVPVRAKTHLRYNQASTMRLLRYYYQQTLLVNKRDRQADPREIDELLSKTFIVQRKLSKEARREVRSRFNVDRFRNYLSAEKTILRSIFFMYWVYQISPECEKIFSTPIIVEQFHLVICDVLDKIALSLDENRKEPLTLFTPNLDLLKDAIAMRKLPEQDLVYAYTFLFCAERLLHRLNELATLAFKKR